ncbi:hypothetical protein EON63_10325 [archaeon]|nr:MAG: hypothetical protein EON63_10325 [archaeon]
MMIGKWQISGITVEFDFESIVSVPYTIHHIPYTINHIPYTIYHTPYTGRDVFLILASFVLRGMEKPKDANFFDTIESATFTLTPSDISKVWCMVYGIWCKVYGV